MYIDVHWHYMPEQCRARISQANRAQLDIPELYRPELQVAWMDRRRIDLAAVSPSPGLLQYESPPDEGIGLHRTVNDGIAELVTAHPDRFVGLGAVPLQAPDLAVAELERIMQTKGMRGIEIGTNVAGRNLDDESLRPVFRRAGELGAFVFVHPMNVLGMDRLGRYYLQNLIGNPTDTAVAIASLIFGGVYDECPSLTCCFAHGGGTFPALVGRWRHGHHVRKEPHMFGAQSPDEYLPRIYIDSLVHDDAICRHAINTVGSDNMMLGCDHPYDMGSLDPVNRIERLDGLGDRARQRILGGTARRLLGL
jgi:aminocarboxymuconate-semialdehyde decarboxylase